MVAGEELWRFQRQRGRKEARRRLRQREPAPQQQQALAAAIGTNPVGTNAGGTNPLGTNAGGPNPFGSWSPGGYDALNKRAVDVRFMPTINECATTSCALSTSA